MTRVAQAVFVAALVAGALRAPASAETLGQIAAATHIHGLAADRSAPGRLWIATHHGLYSATPDGNATRVSPIHDFMGFNAHPRDGATLFASGHPQGGGNLGFVVSGDGGKTWTPLSQGAGGPVDFHQLTVSAADPRVLYGAYRGIQSSRNGGRTWTIAGAAPDRLIDLSASVADPLTVYAATESGLLVSRNGGATFEEIVAGAPVSLVEATANGVYAYVLGRGLVRADKDGADFAIVAADVGARYLLHLAADPQDPARLYAVDEGGRILASGDGGRTWALFGPK